MALQSEVILSRYRHIERETDAIGRVIGVRKLKPSEQTKVLGFTSDLTGFDKAVGPNGAEMIVPHRLPLLCVAAVCEIDGNPIPFAKTRQELDAIFDKLDGEGLDAASKAIAKLQVSGEVVSDTKEAAKN